MRILITNDDQSTRKLLEHIVESNGHIAVSTIDGLELCRKTPNNGRNRIEISKRDGCFPSLYGT